MQEQLINLLQEYIKNPEGITLKDLESRVAAITGRQVTCKGSPDNLRIEFPLPWVLRKAAALSLEPAKACCKAQKVLPGNARSATRGLS